MLLLFVDVAAASAAALLMAAPSADKWFDLTNGVDGAALGVGTAVGRLWNFSAADVLLLLLVVIGAVVADVALAAGLVDINRVELRLLLLLLLFGIVVGDLNCATALLVFFGTTNVDDTGLFNGIVCDEVDDDLN